MSSEGKSSVASGGGAALVPERRFREFAAMAGWGTVPGNELFQQINNRQAPPGLPILAITQEHGAIPRDLIGYHVSVTDQSVEAYKEVKPGDFIISLRSFQGGIEYSNYHGICSPAYVILRKRANISDQFFKQYFKSRSFIQQLTRNLEGLRDGKMISYKQFSELRLLKPTLPEQQKIAECLDSVDALIAAQGRKLEALKAHKKGLMQQLFPQEGETQPRIRFPEFEGAGEWEEIPLSKLVSSLDAGVSVNSGDRPAMSHEIGVLKTSAVTNGIFDPLENKVVFDDEEIKRVKEPVRADTVIISRMNTPALVGANAYVKDDYPNFFLPDRLWAAKPRPGADMRFVALLLGSDRGRAALSGLAGGSSGSMKNISKSSVLELVVMAPSRREQQRIADCLTSLDDLIAAETRKLDTVKTHKKGLMQKLFPQVREVGA
ncbi:restriction endonuclease subunit S [Agrobacterium tumefaciens]|nr:restriction endonuclease subunit S [Agrobacterium tumefaciens]